MILRFVIRYGMQFMTSHDLTKDTTQLIIAVVNYHAQFSIHLHT